MADTMTLEQVLIEVRIVANNGCMTITRENCAEWADAIDAAIKQHEQDAKDAARYRWLREHHDSTRPDWHIRTPTNDAPAIGALDAAIDAAMAQESGR